MNQETDFGNEVSSFGPGNAHIEGMGRNLLEQLVEKVQPDIDIKTDGTGESWNSEDVNAEGRRVVSIQIAQQIPDLKTVDDLLSAAAKIEEYFRTGEISSTGDNSNFDAGEPLA